jgi:hypothetical protein
VAEFVSLWLVSPGLGSACARGACPEQRSDERAQDGAKKRRFESIRVDTAQDDDRGVAIGVTNGTLSS